MDTVTTARWLYWMSRTPKVISPKGNPLISNLKMKLENFLLLLNLSTVPILPPWPPEIKRSLSVAPLSHTLTEELKPCLFQGISFSLPAPPPLLSTDCEIPSVVKETSVFFCKKAWRNHHQWKRIGPCQAKSRCGKAMVRAGGTLALGLRVLCWQQGVRVLSVAQLALEHNQILESGYL